MTGPGLLAQVIGGSDVLDVRLAGAALPDSSLGPLTIRHGRDGGSGQPDAATCTVTLLSDPLTRLPVIGDRLEIDLGPAVLTWAGLLDTDPARPRFRGDVTDVSATNQRRGEPPTVTVTATSRRARLGRTYVGDVPWPEELDGARARRVLDLATAPAGLVLADVDPGTVTVLARDVDRKPALELLEELANDARALLVEQRDGRIGWHDANHRGRAAVDVDLAADALLADLVSAQNLSGIVNALSVTYGPTVEGSERPVESFADTASQTSYGPFAATVSTQLAQQTAAIAFARAEVGRRSRPRWRLDALELDLIRYDPTTGAGVTPALAAALWRLEVADLLRLTGLPSSAPFAGSRRWVEGWTETISRHSWRVTLATSDYGLAAPAPRWVDVPTDLSWNETGDVVWLQAEGHDFGEQYLGRWVDQPADLQWQDVDPALTWSAA